MVDAASHSINYTSNGNGEQDIRLAKFELKRIFILVHANNMVHFSGLANDSFCGSNSCVSSVEIWKEGFDSDCHSDCHHCHLRIQDFGSLQVCG